MRLAVLAHVEAAVGQRELQRRAVDVVETLLVVDLVEAEHAEVRPEREHARHGRQRAADASAALCSPTPHSMKPSGRAAANAVGLDRRRQVAVEHRHRQRPGSPRRGRRARAPRRAVVGVLLAARTCAACPARSTPPRRTACRARRTCRTARRARSRRLERAASRPSSAIARAYSSAVSASPWNSGLSSMNDTPLPMTVCASDRLGTPSVRDRLGDRGVQRRESWPSHSMTRQPSAAKSATIGTGMISAVCPEIWTPFSRRPR